jgi:multicomponent Na+:H+ antiporter subunit E
MMANASPVRFASRAALVRFIGLFLFWVVVAGLKFLDLMVGALAALITTWVSLKLMPPGDRRVRPIKLVKYALRFLSQSVAAGLDVAWRAVDPRMPLQPGFVTYRARLPAGTTLDAFCTVSSLLPGTLPCGPDASGGNAIHCLDVTQPVVRQMAEEEALFSEALGERRDND